MPTKISTPQDDSPRGPQSSPGLPDRSQDRPATQPVIDKGDTKNPNDPLKPALLPIGNPLAWLEESSMSTDDSNATPEQKQPRDVHRPPGQPSQADERSKAPPMVQPPGGKDESEKPVVNPVTGAAI